MKDHTKLSDWYIVCIYAVLFADFYIKIKARRRQEICSDPIVLLKIEIHKTLLKQGGNRIRIDQFAVFA